MKPMKLPEVKIVYCWFSNSPTLSKMLLLLLLLLCYSRRNHAGFFTEKESIQGTEVACQPLRNQNRKCHCSPCRYKKNCWIQCQRTALFILVKVARWCTKQKSTSWVEKYLYLLRVHRATALVTSLPVQHSADLKKRII